MLGYDDDDDGQGLYAWRFRDTCVCSNVSLCVACSNVHACEGDLILKQSLLQDFGRENELLYFLTVLRFHRGKSGCLLPHLQRDNQPRNIMKTGKQKRINCSLRMRKTSVCPINVHNKDMEDPRVKTLM